ncbi:MAG: iron-sulfur cluster-binding protein [Acidobacteria bacterium SCN 69-37]|nr:MAG: iron-sulfur cluster-binding protein [Acidobacteria bacterium SCN 69-37]
MTTPAPQPFHQRTEAALADAHLNQTLRRVTARVLDSRTAGLERLPASDDWRDHARRIRAHTLAHLDRYLDEFVTNVEARGGHVHYARTAEDAVTYVTDLARARGLTKAVKSKSMISEEIHLNDHLERAGLQVVETDLGEWVVQLAQDHPSHVIMPIIHKSASDVADLFRRTLGATDEEVADVPAMTKLARARLRPEFLSADLGISGVNFGVAGTGTLCICTNEGNGRLVTTLPRVHVAMMGIERLVPDIPSLGTVLQVLARSATGQNLTVYTNLLTGPRRPDEFDGPEELHVVLVDNGRSTVLGSTEAEILYCIRCGACLNVCPVYQQIGGHAYGSVYPGPVGAVLTPALWGQDEWTDLPHASSLCGACREVCPVRIDIPRMLLTLRAKGVDEGRAPSWIGQGLAMFRRVAARPWLFGAAGRAAAFGTRLLASRGWIRRLPGPLAGWTASRDFPVMAGDSFQDRWKKRQTGKPGGPQS